MPLHRIFNDISTCETADAVFKLTCDYFQGQGFGAVIYVAPQAAAGPYTLMECGMPAEWKAHYQAQSLHLYDPIPGIAFRLGHPARLSEIMNALPSLNPEEQAYIEAFKTSGLTDGLVVPTYGPFGRPGLIGLVNGAHPDLLDQIDISLAAAVAQQVHIRMELLQISEPPPGLSPREREILGWLAKGKSVADIATICGLKRPTVSTHIQRIYAKLRVNDRVNCVAKALARHYI